MIVLLNSSDRDPPAGVSAAICGARSFPTICFAPDFGFDLRAISLPLARVHTLPRRNAVSEFRVLCGCHKVACD